jgi:hypothetical protein
VAESETGGLPGEALLRAFDSSCSVVQEAFSFRDDTCLPGSVMNVAGSLQFKCDAVGAYMLHYDESNNCTGRLICAPSQTIENVPVDGDLFF